MMIGSAVMSNIRRIYRYKAFKTQQNKQEITEINIKDAQPNSFCSFIIGYFRSMMGFLVPEKYTFSC
jgi:hypothetical protein